MITLPNHDGCLLARSGSSTVPCHKLILADSLANSAYGSTKDVSAYKHIGVPRDALFVHGKGTSHVNYLPTGFTEEHLEYVMGRRAASHSAGAAA
ncbi:hypothetical protein SARC_16230, partial [Sphaeroforma arctica JP610]